MNERIRELADQAELTIRTSTGTYMSHPEFNQKFAELIVEECGVALHPMLRDMISRGHAYNLIKEHFGVES